MKVISKQKQFSTAMKRGKMCNIERLINDPEVDPAINNNWAISISLHNWERFQLLNSSDRVNPFINYKDNLTQSIAEKNSEVFNYLRDHELFKDNISSCIRVASQKNSNLFKELYFNEHYSNKDKEKDFVDLLELSFTQHSPEVFKFLLENNKDKDIDFSEYILEYNVFSDTLKVVVSDKRALKAFDMEKLLISFVNHLKEDSFKILCSANIEYDMLAMINLVYKKFMKQVRYTHREEYTIYRSMLCELIKHDNTFIICKKTKETNHKFYLEFKKEIDLKFLKSKLSTF